MLLGPVGAVSDGGPLQVGGPKQRALLAALLLERGRLVPREALVDALWGERPPGSAAASLQVYVHGLRRALGRERIATAGSGYRVALEPGELDVERFEALLDRALKAGEPAAALEDVEAALRLWRGAPLADLRGLPLAEAVVPRLEELRLRALELRGDALLALGEADALLPELEALIAEHPYHERLREQQILALYRSGRQKEALDAHREARRMLRDDLGVDPGAGLQELERAILRQDASLARPALPAPTPSRLPAAATALVGRRLEIAAVEALLREEARLVTLTGPGGTGKTRLALAAAEHLAGGLRDGACFVDASSATTAEALLQEIVNALELEAADDDLVGRVVGHVRDRSMLLVLDNLEQLGRETQPIGAILAGAPRLRVLATSRVPLRLSAEHEYPVPPLPVPAPGEERFEELVANDAVRLFTARARAADPSFALAGDDAADVASICRRLDGLPLALELAAAWVKLLSPAEIEQRLGRALDLLVEGARDLPRRQQTLRATLDWSYDLLDDRGRRLLAELSVFVGGWTLEDAEAVVGADVVAGLASLVEHSLVRRRGDRFTMLETIRTYAAERLDDVEVARRHARRFVEVAERARVGILEGGDAEAAAFTLLDVESANIGAALDWAERMGEPELQVRIAVALRWYWLVRGRLAEGLRVFERVAAVSGHLPAVYAHALGGAAMFNHRRGDHELAKTQFVTARQLFAELGDSDEEARCMAELGGIAVDEGDLDGAAHLYAEVAAVFERIGSDYRFAVALSNLAAIDVRRGNLEAAAATSARAIELQRSLDDLSGLGVSLANLGRLQITAGDVDAGCATLAESMDLALRLDYRMLIAYLLGSAGDVAALAERDRDAVRLIGAGRELFAEMGMPVPPEEVSEHERALVPLRARLGAPVVDELLREGAEASVQEMIDLACSFVQASTMPFGRPS